MAKIDLTKPSSTPQPLPMSGGRLQAYIMLGFGALDLLERSPIGVDTADVRLRDLVRRGRRRPMVLVPRERSLRAVAAPAAPVVLHDAIAVVVNAGQHPLGVITRSQIARAKDLAA